MTRTIPTTLVLADLHLDSTDTSVTAPDQLDGLLDGVDRVVFAGDTFESFRRDDDGVLIGIAATRDAVSDYLAGKGIAADFITGNHDPVASEKNALYIESARTVITHGDLFTLWMAPWSELLDGLADYFTRRAQEEGVDLDGSDFDAYSAVLRRYYLEFMAQLEVSRVTRRTDSHFLIRLFRKLIHPNRVFELIRYRYRCHRMALIWLRRFYPEATTCLFGHYHYPKIREIDGRRLVSLGSFTPLSRPMGAIVTDSVRVLPIVRRGNRFVFSRRMASMGGSPQSVI